MVLCKGRILHSFIFVNPCVIGACKFAMLAKYEKGENGADRRNRRDSCGELKI